MVIDFNKESIEDNRNISLREDILVVLRNHGYKTENLEGLIMTINDYRVTIELNYRIEEKHG